ncbi:MAG: RAMP superfamily CRISPR-associated protein [Bacteroidota bacterium]|jgi:CRISPR/Cas system CSM-associated protein Csm3 (group 7 of RAMP superfamily)
MSKEQLIGKAILSAVLYNESPLLMGAGGGDYTDKIIQLVEGRPYLDAESLGGALRSHLKQYYDIPQDILDIVFGTELDGKKQQEEKEKNQKNNSQSHLRISDGFLLPDSQPEIVVFDGICIEPDSGLVADGKKYDYEALASRCGFVLNMELSIRDMHKEAQTDMLKLLNTIGAVFASGEFRAGAFTRTGYGILKTEQPAAIQRITAGDAWKNFLDHRKEATRQYFTNHPETSSVGIAWLTTQANPETFETFKKHPSVTESITATYMLRDTLMSGGGKKLFQGGDSKDSDKIMTGFNGQPYVTGKALKGALNILQRRILNARFDEKNEVKQIIEHINGLVTEEKVASGKQVKASRLSLHGFAVDKKMAIPYLRDRVAIDAFTGGALPGKKFDSSPLVALQVENRPQIRITLTLQNPHDFELGLLVLCLRELGSERASLGGESALGAGILELQTLTINTHKKKAIEEAWVNPAAYLQNIQKPHA